MDVESEKISVYFLKVDRRRLKTEQPKTADKSVLPADRLMAFNLQPSLFLDLTGFLNRILPIFSRGVNLQTFQDIQG